MREEALADLARHALPVNLSLEALERRGLRRDCMVAAGPANRPTWSRRRRCLELVDRR